MKLVIDIPKEMIEAAKTDMWCGSPTIGDAIKNGTPYEERPRGEWEKKAFCYDYFYCSKCGFAYKHAFNFCPNCGLPMTEKALEILRKRGENRNE